MTSLFGDMSRNISLLVGLPFLFIALIFIVLWLRSRAKVSAARQWPSVSGKVLFGTVEQRRSRSGQSGMSTSYYPSVVYEYMVNGQRYQNNRVTLGSEVGRGSYTAVERKVASYPVGSQVEVYYNPDNPLDAALEKSAPAGNLFLIIALVILAILACTFAMTAGSLGFVSQLLNGVVPQVAR